MSDNHKLRRNVRLGCGGLLLLLSVPCIISGVIEIFTSPLEELAGGLGAMTFFVLVAVGGGWVLKMGLEMPKEPPLEVSEGEERMALRMAHAEGGRLSASKLAMKSNLDVERAEALLEEFASRGMAHATVNAGGGIEYDFPGLESDGGPRRLEEKIEEAAGG